MQAPSFFDYGRPRTLFYHRQQSNFVYCLGDVSSEALPIMRKLCKGIRYHKSGRVQNEVTATKIFAASMKRYKARLIAGPVIGKVHNGKLEWDGIQTYQLTTPTKSYVMRINIKAYTIYRITVLSLTEKLG
jgi:hypothetical protein